MASQNPEQADDKQMGRIIDIEKPLHLFALASGTVYRMPWEILPVLGQL